MFSFGNCLRIRAHYAHIDTTISYHIFTPNSTTISLFYWYIPVQTSKAAAKRRGFIRQYPLQNQSFDPILQKIAMAGVSLTIAIFLVLSQNLCFWSAFAVLRLGFFLAIAPWNTLLPLQGKRLAQNRMLSYETPPNVGFFHCWPKYCVLCCIVVW